MRCELEDRNVLVTGGSRGIGREIAAAFSAEGARVALTYHSGREQAEEAARELGADRGRALALPYSLGDPASSDAVVDRVVDEWGSLDVLVANAVSRGVRRAPGEGAQEVSEEEWGKVLLDNLHGTMRLTLKALNAGMRTSGWGRIVLLSSHNALGGGRGQEFYGASKAGLHGFARSLAWDVGGAGVLVNVVCPGLTGTDPVLTVLPEHVREGERRLTPSGRLSTPREVAAAVVFLGSGANGNITGEALSVSGGR
ncbi:MULTISPECIES: SDR family NAD(P)-dependent oxidoreductase [unclassified Nocardiopsis]|uniref:SDR family NAD(P)-dependent oxidoreductase n=1 Tax=Nocardiopsis TaxID=2013 RepID=UPI00387AFDA6